jgi:hypothetical protein
MYSSQYQYEFLITETNIFITYEKYLAKLLWLLELGESAHVSHERSHQVKKNKFFKQKIIKEDMIRMVIRWGRMNMVDVLCIHIGHPLPLLQVGQRGKWGIEMENETNVQWKALQKCHNECPLDNNVCQ